MCRVSFSQFRCAVEVSCTPNLSCAKANFISFMQVDAGPAMHYHISEQRNYFKKERTLIKTASTGNWACSSFLINAHSIA